MRRTLSDKRVILTGASSGIGRELAILLYDRGARLILNARRTEKLEELVREMNAVPERVQIVSGSVTEETVRRELVLRSEKVFGGLDLLINNAGIGAMGEFHTASPSRLREIMEVNFFAPVELTRLALPLLAKGITPAVVSIDSVLGYFAVPDKSEYCASKFALRGMMSALRSELLDSHIDVLSISPSTTDTPFFDNAIEDTVKKNWKKRGSMSPRRVAEIAIRSIERGRLDTFIGWGTWFLLWIDRIAPSISARLFRNA